MTPGEVLNVIEAFEKRDILAEFSIQYFKSGQTIIELHSKSSISSLWAPVMNPAL